MRDTGTMRRVSVIGVGNILLRDDGIGVHAIQALRQQPCPHGVDVEIVDGGAAPDISVYVEAGLDKLIIIDAVQGRGKPGSVYRFTPDALDAGGGDAASLHDLNIKESLGLMRLAGTLPAEVVIIGVEPATMDLGMTLSPELQQALPEVVRVVLREIETCR